ncbi:MAG: GNAT family N-acetyltransferase, partial [Lachnospiraceae bacterium]|nr:GNAT family N-acetyltransferase [Lachnospiraceae bacterium]
AGWNPLRDVSDSRRVIRDVLTRPEIYAITLRDSAEAVGSVGLQNFRLADSEGSCLTFFDERRSADPLMCTRPGDEPSIPEGYSVEAALGYWLAEPYWHRGIMTEAAGAVLEHARKDLGMRRVWADYYEGNEPSAKVMKRLGFHFHHIEEDRYVEALKEKRTAIVQVMELFRLG